MTTYNPLKATWADRIADAYWETRKLINQLMKAVKAELPEYTLCACIGLLLAANNI